MRRDEINYRGSNYKVEHKGLNKGMFIPENLLNSNTNLHQNGFSGKFYLKSLKIL